MFCLNTQHESVYSACILAEYFGQSPLYIFICGLFADAVTISDFISLSDRITDE